MNNSSGNGSSGEGDEEESQRVSKPVSTVRDTGSLPNSVKSKPRAMPASVRKKLEEARAGSSLNLGTPNVAGGDEKTKTGRPMPASARKKLLGENPKPDESLTPAPKLEEKRVTSDHSNEVSIKNSIPSRPMPASIRKKLEENAKRENSPMPTPSHQSAKAVKSSSSAKKPMPASAKRKLEEETPTCPDASKSVPQSTSSSTNKPNPVKEKLEKAMTAFLEDGRGLRGSFKRKIDEVLCRQDSRAGRDDEEDDDVDEMENSGVKKIILSEGNTATSAKKRPMPASAKKKIQAKQVHAPASDKMDVDAKSVPVKAVLPPRADLDDVDDDECEVCHRVFSSCRKRQKHELTVHFIENPRGPLEEQDQPTSSNPVPSTSASFPDKTEKGRVNSSSDINDKMRTSMEEKPISTEASEQTFDFKRLPACGECPICGKSIATKLKQHVVRMHFHGDKEAAMLSRMTLPKLGASQAAATTTSSSPIPKPTTNRPGPASSKRKLEQQPQKPITRSSEGEALKPLKILAAAYQRTFKINKSKSGTGKRSQAQLSPSTADNDGINYSDNDNDNEMASTGNEIMSAGEDDAEAEAMPSPSPPPPKHAKPPAPMKSIPSANRIELKVPIKKTGFAGPKSAKERMSKLTQANWKYKCTKCNETFMAEADYKEHVKNYHLHLKKVFVCKVCRNMFTQMEDFIHHMKSKHKELVDQHNKETETANGAGITPLVPSATSRRPNSIDPGHDQELMDTSCNENDRGDGDSDRAPDPNFSMEKSPSSEEEKEETELAITSTFSQKQSTPTLVKSKSANEISCTSCDEKFYDLEVLRKHELFFHSNKAVKMCPICGVYPTRLGRHLIAHENKTVRCCCTVCQLNFSDFGDLLKHNLANHPGPQGTDGASKNETNLNSNSTEGEGEGEEEMYECTLCKKQLPGAAQARKHVRRNHPEYNDYPSSNYVAKVMQVKISVNSKPKPSSTSVSRPKAMPASVRAKMESEKSKKTGNDSSVTTTTITPEADKASSSSSLAAKPKLPRAMPASVRAKLLQAKQESSPSSEAVKEAGPLPGSSSSTVSSKTSRPKAMPASVREKMMETKSSSNKGRNSGSVDGDEEAGEVLRKRAVTNEIDDPEIILEKEGPPLKRKRAVEFVDLEDEGEQDDDVIVEQDFSFPQPQIISTPHVDHIPIDHEIEHEKPVNINVAVGKPSPQLQVRVDYFQCKMCERKFETREGARKHILQTHSEYGPEHTENLIGTVYVQSTPPQDKKTRKRSSGDKGREDDTDYNPEEDEEDDEDEVIIPRGTTRRPRSSTNSSSRVAPITASSSSGSQSGNMEHYGYACKICKKKAETPGNVKRHIMRAHPKIPPIEREDYVNKLYYADADKHDTLQVEEQDMVPMQQEPMLQEEEATTTVQNHLGVHMYTCSLCPYFSTDEGDYGRHYRKKHVGIYPYHCHHDHCGATFYYNSHLAEHLAREHSTSSVGVGESLVRVPTSVPSSSSSSISKVISAEVPGVQTESRSVNVQESMKSSSLVPISSTESTQKKYKPGPASRKRQMAVSQIAPTPTPSQPQPTMKASSSSSSNVLNRRHFDDTLMDLD